MPVQLVAQRPSRRLGANYLCVKGVQSRRCKEVEAFVCNVAYLLGGNKGTEVALAKLFRRHKITGWRRHREVRIQKSGASTFKVRPDFVFPKLKLAVFVDGCFWHGCPRHGTKPKGNAAFWKNKFARNIARDRLVTRRLRRAGWRVLRIWEHELVRRRETQLLNRLERVLTSAR